MLARAWSLVDTVGNPAADTIQFFREDFSNFCERLHSCKVLEGRAEQHNNLLQEVAKVLLTWLNMTHAHIFDPVTLHPKSMAHGRCTLQVLQMILQMFDSSKSQFYKDYDDLHETGTHKL